MLPMNAGNQAAAAAAAAAAVVRACMATTSSGCPIVLHHDFLRARAAPCLYRIRCHTCQQHLLHLCACLSQHAWQWLSNVVHYVRWR